MAFLLAISLLCRPPLLAFSHVPGIALFVLGAMCCYLIIYTGIEDPSPSLILLQALEAAGDRGCPREDLAALFTEDRLVRPRLDELKQDGLVAAAGDGHALTPRGLRVVRVALFTTRIFRINDNA